MKVNTHQKITIRKQIQGNEIRILVPNKMHQRFTNSTCTCKKR